MSFVFRTLPLLAAAACLAYPFFAADLSVEMFWALCTAAAVFLTAAAAVACRDPLPAHFSNNDSLKNTRDDDVWCLSDTAYANSPYYVETMKD